MKESSFSDGRLNIDTNARKVAESRKVQAGSREVKRVAKVTWQRAIMM